MKKKSRFTMLLFTLVMLFALAIPVNASAASSKTKALKAYKTFLSKSKMNIYVGPVDGTYSLRTSKMKFALIYLDNDSIPELVIDNTPSMTGNYFPAGYAVFTYKNGKVTQLYCQNSNYKIASYYKKKSVIYFPNRIIDGLGLYRKIKGTKETNIATIDDPKYYKGDSYFSKKPKRITKAQFNKLLKKYTGSTKATMIKYYKNTAANRKKYLK